MQLRIDEQTFKGGDEELVAEDDFETTALDLFLEDFAVKDAIRLQN